jgi:uncharacterized membrane protein YbhN (UPF0104 family)
MGPDDAPKAPDGEDAVTAGGTEAAATASAEAAGTGSDEAAGTGSGEASGGGPGMPSRRAAILRSGVIVLVMLVVFGLILPQFVDYREVAAALMGLTLAQIAVMTVLGIIAWFVCGQLFVLLIPGLSRIRGMQAYLILSGIGSSIPFGPWNMGVVWVVFRGWGIPAQSSTSGVALYGIVNTLSRFALPLFAAIIVAVTGELLGARRGVLVITAISSVIFVVVVVVMMVVVSSQRAADWIGRKVGRVVVSILERLSRPERPDVDGAIHRFQAGVGKIVHEHGPAALGLTLLAQIPWSIAFVVALRFTGVPEEVLPASAVIAVFALVAVITIIPIAPGGAGVPELLYIAGLSAIAGESWEAAITAGVFLFRLYVWFLPIPLAWILLKVVRRGRPMLPTAGELRSYATTA